MPRHNHVPPQPPQPILSLTISRRNPRQPILSPDLPYPTACCPRIMLFTIVCTFVRAHKHACAHRDMCRCTCTTWTMKYMLDRNAPGVRGDRECAVRVLDCRPTSGACTRNLIACARAARSAPGSRACNQDRLTYNQPRFACNVNSTRSGGTRPRPP